MVTLNGVIILTATRKSKTKKKRGSNCCFSVETIVARTRQNVTSYVRYISYSAFASCVILTTKIDNRSTDQAYYCSLLLSIEVIFQSFS